MGYRYSCVIDRTGYYKGLVMIQTEGEEERVQHYVLGPGERLLDASPPGNMARPKWDGSGWIEGATAEEIAKWEAAHPIPGPEGPTLTDRVADIEDALATILFGDGGGMV